MRVLTVRQPWAGSIVWHGKSPENRSHNIAGSYRGPVAIHVSLRHDYSAVEAHNEVHGFIDQHNALGYGAVIGVVDLVSVHHDSDHGRGYPCSLWALADDWHLMVENARPVEPIPAKGRLGLWKPDADLEAQIRAALATSPAPTANGAS